VPRLAAVISSSRKPVSAKQNLSQPRSRRRAILCRLAEIFLTLILVPQFSRADSVQDSARALAREVSSLIHAASATCEFHNLSSLQKTDFANLSAAFQEELQRRGVKILAADADLKLVVSVTQNPTMYLGVVQIQRKENTETVIETIAQVDGPGAPGPPFSLTLHREFLFSQNSPILDVVFNSDPKIAFVLGAQEIIAYGFREDHWISTGSERLPRHRMLKRRERGFFGIGIDSESAVFPEESCWLSMLPGTKGWECQKNTQRLAVRDVSPDAIAGKKLEPWISAAQVDTDGKTRIVVTGEDGLARLYEDGPDPVAVFAGWGSEIASLYSGCGSGWQLLVTGQGDGTKPDEIQAVDIQERRAQSVSDPMDFPGPIVALHAPGMRRAGNPEKNPNALVVERNLQTGRYDAYLLSVTCSK